jgi:outer membrane protein OmpA-like peptidoglycan-associated protein
MKNITKIVIIAIMFVAFVQAASAIEQTVGLRFGCSHFLNDINDSENEYTKDVKYMAGLSYEAWLKDWVSLGIYPYYTNLIGSATNVDGTNLDPSFTTDVLGGDIQARFRPTKGAVINFDKGVLTRIAPYANIGLGVAYYDSNDNGDMDGKIGFVAPTAGLGISFLTKWNVNFDLGAQFDHILADDVDNYPEDDFFTDSHIMPYLGVGYTFGKKGGKGVATPYIPRKILRNVISMEEDFTLDGVQFEFDSDKLTESAKVVLNDVVDAMKKYPNVKVDIQGHTDNVGDASYNLDLSLRRAESVKTYLVSKGISAARITTRGYGESKPVASNDTAEGRAQNRRIEFVIVK